MMNDETMTFYAPTSTRKPQGHIHSSHSDIMGRNAEENERNQKKKPHCRIVVWDAMTTSVCLFISSYQVRTPRRISLEAGKLAMTKERRRNEWSIERGKKVREKKR
jgi:hypothetical protein